MQLCAPVQLGVGPTRGGQLLRLAARVHIFGNDEQRVTGKQMVDPNSTSQEAQVTGCSHGGS